jgi:hypothetical protein
MCEFMKGVGPLGPIVNLDIMKKYMLGNTSKLRGVMKMNFKRSAATLGLLTMFGASSTEAQNKPSTPPSQVQGVRIITEPNQSGTVFLSEGVMYYKGKYFLVNFENPKKIKTIDELSGEPEALEISGTPKLGRLGGITKVQMFSGVALMIDKALEAKKAAVPEGPAPKQ